MIVPVVLLVLAAIVFLWVASSVAGFVFFTIVPWVLLGLIAGWVAGKVVGSPYGLAGDILVGIAGSVIGGALFSLLFHIRTGNVLSVSHLLVSIVGAIILLAVMRGVRSVTA